MEQPGRPAKLEGRGGGTRWGTGSFLALRYPAFRRYWLSQALSLLGTWTQITAQSYLVLQLSHNSSTALALVTVVRFLPTLLLSLFAGAVIDRSSRRAVLLTTQSILMLTSLVLALLTQTNRVTYGAVLILSAIAGAANAFDMPARQSMISDFVPRAELPNAVALNSMSFNASRALGQALFGATAGLGALAFGRANGTEQLALSFYLNTLSFVVVIVVLARLPFPRRPVVSGNLLSEMRAGLSYVRRTPGLLYTLLVVGVVSLTIMNFNILVPYYARAVFHLGESGFGLLNGVFGLGAMLGAFVMTGLRLPLRTLRVGVYLMIACTALLAGCSAQWLAALLLLGCGFAMMLVTISANSATQLEAPDRLRGRIMSVYTFVVNGANPFGALFMGGMIGTHTPLGPHWGLLAVVLLGGLPAVLFLRALPVQQGP